MLQIDNINVVAIDKDTIRYHNYIIKRNGEVTDKKGKVIKKYNLHYPYSHISLMINGKKCKKNIARLIYSLFTELDTSEPTKSNKQTLLFFKDGDTQNVSYDNLEVVTRKEGYRRTGKATKRDSKTGDFLPRFSKEQAEKIREEYNSISEGKNRNQFNKETPSIRDLADKYECSASLIAKIVKGKYYNGEEKIT